MNANIEVIEDNAGGLTIQNTVTRAAMTIYELEQEFDLADGGGPAFVGPNQGFRTAWENMNNEDRAALTRGENRQLRRNRLWTLGSRRNGYHSGFTKEDCLQWRTL